MYMISNPGTGPVDDANAANATTNVVAFVEDLHHADRRGRRVKLAEVVVRRAPRLDYGEGRFAFVLSVGMCSVEVQMPGLPIDRVRYFDGANPWNFPRLYVDGNSWLWEFALGRASDALSGAHEEPA